MKNAFVKFSVAMVMGLAMSACGSSEDGGQLPPPSGQPGGLPGYVPGTFEQGCNAAYGTYSRLSNNGQACVFNRSHGFMSDFRVRLSPDGTTGGFDIFGFDLRAGEKIKVSNLSGCWDPDGRGTYLYSIGWGGVTCTEITIGGYNTDEKYQEPDHGGLAQGLIGTFAGNGAFLLGNAGSTLTVSRDGRFKVGYNAPDPSFEWVGRGGFHGSFTLSRCIDANGNSFSCPF